MYSEDSTRTAQNMASRKALAAPPVKSLICVGCVGLTFRRTGGLYSSPYPVAIGAISSRNIRLILGVYNNEADRIILSEKFLVSGSIPSTLNVRHIIGGSRIL